MVLFHTVTSQLQHVGVMTDEAPNTDAFPGGHNSSYCASFFSFFSSMMQFQIQKHWHTCETQSIKADVALLFIIMETTKII